MRKRFIGVMISLCVFTLVVNLGGLEQVTQAQTVTTLPPVPAGLKSTFTIGLANLPENLAWMTNSATAWDSRYQYLSGGVNTSGNWKTWQDPNMAPGQFATDYLNRSDAAGYMPVLTWYQVLQSSPASGGSEAEKDFNNLNNGSTMNAYFSDFKLLMDRAKSFGKTTIVHVEPDFWGFMEKRSSNPANISAAVASSGYPDLAGYSNNLAGFARALVSLRDRYAPNVLLAYHVNPWASAYGDISTNTDPGFNVNGAAQEIASFYNQLGANFNLLFYDIADRDAALYASWGNPNAWWDLNNVRFPNFNRC